MSEDWSGNPLDDRRRAAEQLGNNLTSACKVSAYPGGALVITRPGVTDLPAGGHLVVWAGRDLTPDERAAVEDLRGDLIDWAEGLAGMDSGGDGGLTPSVGDQCGVQPPAKSMPDGPSPLEIAEAFRGRRQDAA